jgi:hypothetical protein
MAPPDYLIFVLTTRIFPQRHVPHEGACVKGEQVVERGCPPAGHPILSLSEK